MTVSANSLKLLDELENRIRQSKAPSKKIKIGWWPQPRQLTFLHACGLDYPYTTEDGPRPPVARVIGYGGAAGGGKSDSLVMVGTIACYAFPGCKVGYFRREYPQLEGPGGAIMRSQELLTGYAKWNGSKRRWTFPNGSVFQFCHAKKETDVYSYQSQQFDVILFDEITQFTRFQYRYLLTRNRATVEGIIPFAAAATNPGNIGHLWFKLEFVDPGPAEQVHEVEVEPGKLETHIFIPARLSDNKILESRDPGYRAILENQDEDTRKMLLEGDWDIAPGQMFKMWRRNVHVVPAFNPPPEWKRFRAIDYGGSAPFCCLWFAVDNDGNVWVYNEHYLAGEYVTEHAKKIVSMSEGSRIDYTVGDPSMWSKDYRDKVKGESIAETLMNHGVPLIKADNDRLSGCARVKEWLKVFDTPEGPVSRLKVMDNCVNLIRTLPYLPKAKNNPEDVDTDAEDHAYDALRYGLMSRPAPKMLKSCIVPDETRRQHKPVRTVDDIIDECKNDYLNEREVF